MVWVLMERASDEVKSGIMGAVVGYKLKEAVATSALRTDSLNLVSSEYRLSDFRNPP